MMAMKFIYFYFPREIFCESSTNKMSALGKIYSDEIYVNFTDGKKEREG